MNSVLLSTLNSLGFEPFCDFDSFRFVHIFVKKIVSLTSQILLVSNDAMT
jgi:hypothetical protein